MPNGCRAKWHDFTIFYGTISHSKKVKNKNVEWLSTAVLKTNSKLGLIFHWPWQTRQKNHSISE
jgi:hypothetical protein